MACSAMKARCSGCGFSGVPRPSTVTISFPAAAHSGVSHEATAAPSISTLQSPHWLAPQPKCDPVRPSVPRSTLSRGVAGSASTARSAPFTRNLTASAIAAPALLCLDAGLLDDVGPLLDVAAQVRVELGGRHDDRHHALLGP